MPSAYSGLISSMSQGDCNLLMTGLPPLSKILFETVGSSPRPNTLILGDELYSYSSENYDVKIVQTVSEGELTLTSETHNDCSLAFKYSRM